MMRALAMAVIAGAALYPAAHAAPTACDRERGERVFEKCAICHAREAGAPSPVGPSLHGVVGRRAGTLPDFGYSKAMRGVQQSWTVDALDRFLTDPAGTVPGTAMAFGGLRDPLDRTAVICLLAADAGASPATAVGASGGAHDELARTLQARLDFAYGAVWASGDARRFVDEFLTEDAVMTGADSAQAWHGREQLVTAVGALMNDVQAVKAKAVYTRRLARDAAFQFVVFELHGKDADGKDTVSTAKSLYVWSRTPHGWRVAADHYSFAGMDVPQRSRAARED